MLQEADEERRALPAQSALDGAERLILRRASLLVAAALASAAFGCGNLGEGETAASERALPASQSPYRGTIAFQSDREGNWDLYRIEADGSGLERLTDDPAADQNPSWSPDGRWIVFSSERTGAGDLYLMDARGENLRRLTDHPAYEGAPRFTPEGTAVVFEAERDGRAEIYRIGLGADARVERLTSSISRKLGPAYSPDGESLAFMETGLLRWHVSVLDVGSGAIRAVSTNGGACRPAWSPDGKFLAYVSTEDSPKAELWLRDMEGSGAGRAWRVPTRPDAHNYDPAFAPDGTTIAFASTRVRGDGEQWDIFLADWNGRGLVQLTDERGNERFPAFRPF